MAVYYLCNHLLIMDNLQSAQLGHLEDDRPPWKEKSRNNTLNQTGLSI